VLLRDVCQNGFCDKVSGKADAVFLDLPHPHLVIPFAIKALKPSGKILIYYQYIFYQYYFHKN
jgi:tRNA A58 N-methylase Trm61